MEKETREEKWNENSFHKEEKNFSLFRCALKRKVKQKRGRASEKGWQICFVVVVVNVSPCGEKEIDKSGGMENVFLDAIFSPKNPNVAAEKHNIWMKITIIKASIETGAH